MMPTALTRRAQELAERGVPFATATVVRVERPTSAKPGNTALVLEDGTIEGFVGGDCAEQSVREYALRSLRERRDRAAAAWCRSAARRSAVS